MVRKTNRKHSAKRVKTNKRTKSRRRGRGRGRGRGHGGRTAKRGGMPPAARVAARIAARTVASPALIPSQSMKEYAYKEYKEKTTPVELLSAADSAFSAAHKAAYNDRQHDTLQQNQTPARTHTRNLFYTPHQQINILRDEDVRNPMPPTFSSPAGRISSALSSPPPPDLSDEGGSSMSITENPEFRQSYAPTLSNPNPDITNKQLNFETPPSSPFQKKR